MNDKLKVGWSKQYEENNSKIRSNMAKKGIPKRDGSGGGTRKNAGRGGCATTQKSGKGRT